MTRTIDVHTHVVPRGWPDLGARLGGDGWPWLRIDGPDDATIMIDDAEFRRIGANCWDPRVRLVDLDADRVDVQVVSPTPVFFSYDKAAPDATEIARIFNDLTLELCAQAPDRLIPFCQVPLQDPDAACRELDRSLDAGHLGVEIGNHVGDLDLDHEGIVTFLQHCAERGVPVFVHPWDMAQSPRLDRWMAQWLVGMPAETHLSMLSLILGGVLDRVPETLRICFAHGGGSFAFWLGRLENAWHRRSDVIATSLRPPSTYLDRVYVDSVVFDERPLRLLVETFGADRVMLGSDYPYPLGERPVGMTIRKSEFLTIPQREALLGGNAERFLYGPSAPQTPAQRQKDDR